MPSDMDHLHGTDTRDERMAALQAEIARLRKERDRFVRFVVTDTEAQMIGQFGEEINRLSTDNAELRRVLSNTGAALAIADPKHVAVGESASLLMELAAKEKQ